MMPRPTFRAVAAATALVLAACAGTGDLEELQKTEATGSPFSMALTDEYRTFATREADVEYDWPDQKLFARKGLKAAKGEEPASEEVRDWGIDDAEAAAMQDARGRLVTALDGGGRANHPAEAAKAQARFDCWVEQQEEAWQTEDIAACKGEFETALAALDDVMTTAAAPEPEDTPLETAARPQPAPQSFRIQFEFDSAGLDAAAMTEIRNAAAASADYDGAVVTVVGYTDRAGDSAYNRTLSKARANAVAASLREGNIAGAVVVRFEGEANPEVATADGVKEPRNRRVTIEVR